MAGAVNANKDAQNPKAIPIRRMRDFIEFSFWKPTFLSGVTEISIT
jgi:hypothetical protein